MVSCAEISAVIRILEFDRLTRTSGPDIVVLTGDFTGCGEK